MKLLLLGSRGQVGWELQRALQPLGHVRAVAARGVRGGIDLARPGDLDALVRAERPGVVVNAAAWTDVDGAETEPDLAQAVNATAPGVLARAARDLGCLLVHYGTEHVFDGSGEAPRDEDAPTGPINRYGRSKLEGEERIRASGCRHLILRTSWIHSPRRRNFALAILHLAAARDRLEVVDDQVGAPTGADLLADVTAHVLRTTLAQPSLAGTVHVAAGGQTSRLGYAKHLVEGARLRGLPVRVRPESVVGVPSTSMSSAARRPLNSRLATARLQRDFGIVPPPWTTGVDRLLDELAEPLGGAGSALRAEPHTGPAGAPT